jgi:haloacid dehalogenase-like hydrolase
VVPAGTLPPEEVLALAGSLDQVSGHVLAAAVVHAAAERGCPLVLPEAVTEQAGQGIAGTVQGRPVGVGRAGWAGVTGEPPWVRAVRRRARPDARATIRAIRRGGITRVVLATGDRAEAADAVGALTGVEEVLAGLTPAGKLDVVRREQRRAPVIMTGDGINDAPALALADVAIAMGARGSTASSEAADAVLTVDQLGLLGEVAAIARRTRRIALQSVLAGMGMSLAAMAPAAAGLLPAVWGALLQEAIDVAVILNALRALRPPAPAAQVTDAHTELTRRFRTEHQAIRADIDQLDQGQVRQLVLQARLGQRALRGQQDVGGDVDPVVVTGVQVLDEQAARPQVPAADLEHPHARLEAVRDEIVELHLAHREPGFMGAAAHRILVAAGHVRPHHRAVVAHVVPVPQPQRRVAGQAAGVRHDPLRVTQGITHDERQP